jgi:hypothetical protein
MEDFRAALEDVSNFSNRKGHSIVHTVMQTGHFHALDAAFLWIPDGIISPWWADAETTPSAIATAANLFMNNGGDLFLFNDDSAHDAIAAYLGIPTQDSAAPSAFNGSGFPFDGPFGAAANVSISGDVGHLSLADVAATGGKVLGVNGAGQITVAFWDRDDYAAGAGRMLIVTDVNTIGDFFGTAQYSPPNANGRFALNLVAGMIGSFACNDADVDENGVLDVDDVQAFVEAFLHGCP